MAHVCAQARAAGIYVTLKTFPADLEGYLNVIRGFGVHHDGTPMTARQRRRNAARAYARRWLDLKEDEGREGPMPPMPHLDFAVCVKGELPCQYNYASKELEFFNANAGVWMHTGGQAYCRGELLKDALCKVLCTPRWGLDKDGKTRLLPGDALSSTRPLSSRLSGGMLGLLLLSLSSSSRLTSRRRCQRGRAMVVIKSELGEMKNTKKLQADPVNVKTTTKRRQLGINSSVNNCSMCFIISSTVFLSLPKTSLQTALGQQPALQHPCATHQGRTIESPKP